MSVVTKTEDGMEFPAEAYAYVPDPDTPSTWKLRLWETPEEKVTLAQLGRAAAALSPGGFRGNRVQLPDTAVEQVKRRIQSEYGKLGVKDADMPESVKFDARPRRERMLFQFDFEPEPMPVERDAKIFEAGEYPDKELTVTEEDLDEIVGNFAETPVKVEHADSPLDPLGTVKRIWRRGSELLARLAFPKDLAAFLERRGIRKLSVALYRDPLRLAEVSLVLSPRVADAAMFRGETADDGLQTADGGQPSADSQGGWEVKTDLAETQQPDKEKEIADLRFALRSRDVEARLAELKAQGKIVPASESFAREILLQGDGKITFGEGESTIAEMFERFMEAQPLVIAFGELAPASGGREEGAPLSAEEEELLSKLGITREQVSKYSG